MELFSIRQLLRNAVQCEKTDRLFTGVQRASQLKATYSVDALDHSHGGGNSCKRARRWPFRR